MERDPNIVRISGSLRRHTVLLASLWCCTLLYGQTEPKRPVREEDYQLWGTLQEHKLSPDGKWISFQMHYDEAPDTLTIKQASGDRMWKIPDAYYGRFCGPRHYASLNAEKVLQLLDLYTGRTQSFKDVHSLSISGNQEYLVTTEGTDGMPSICIRTPDGKMVERMEGFSQSSLNEKGDALLCLHSGKSRLVLASLARRFTKTDIAAYHGVALSQMAWSGNGTSFAFLMEYGEFKPAAIGYFHLETRKLHTIQGGQTGFPKGYGLDPLSANLSLSHDGQRVFFHMLKENEGGPLPEVVQVWRSSDALIHPRRKMVADLEERIRCAAWWPSTGTFRMISDDSHPIYVLNPTKDFALTYSISDKEPQYTMNLDVDYYVTDLQTGQKKLLVADHTTDNNATGFSPDGRYVAYFKDGVWRVYDFRKGRLANLGAGAGNWNRNGDGVPINYGIAGWGARNNIIFLYDQYDIWRLAFDGSSPIRLTRGREKKTAYRLAPLGSSLSNLAGGAEIDDTGNLLLYGKAEDASGYFELGTDGRINTLAYNDFLNGGIVRAADAEVYAYQSQRYDHPPALNVYDCSKARTAVAYQSNRHHWNYLWGRQEQVLYTNSKKQQLKGLLYYPAGHDPARKYPMVVNIYEELHYQKPYYFNPTAYNPAGFNVAALTSQGYFVLMPDIKYGEGNTGMEAADCVLAATNEAIGTGLVDPARIALMGHSFGGYETNFIIAQSSLFRTAISGASVFDLPSWYLSVSRNSGNPELWRFESQQWRMGKSLYADRERYRRNSPSSWVEQVRTPVLLWSGEDDRQIDPKQSIAFHLALRRLNRQNILLLYPGESHSLLGRDSQADLHGRIRDWLAYFLKDEAPAPWIRKGL